MPKMSGVVPGGLSVSPDTRLDHDHTGICSRRAFAEISIDFIRDLTRRDGSVPLERS